MQSGGRKPTYIVIVAVLNFCVEYGPCTVKQMYENVLNNIVKVADGSLTITILYMTIQRSVILKVLK
jgi:hypothetical protein